MEKIKMTFREAIVSVFSNILNFSGRARRKEYWTFVLLYFILMVGAMFLDAATGFYSNTYDSSYGPCFLVFMIIMFFPHLAVTIRRLHDSGHSGVYILWSLVPFIGGIIMLIATLEDSESGINDYGDSPKYPEIVYEEDYSNEHEEMV